MPEDRPVDLNTWRDLATPWCLRVVATLRIANRIEEGIDDVSDLADLQGGVMNDWPDAEAQAILRRCAEAARGGGRVIVIGGVLPDDAPSNLTVETVLVGGKNRSLDDFRALARAARPDVTATGHQPFGRFVVDCRPI